jgi:hypothetical protein
MPRIMAGLFSSELKPMFRSFLLRLSLVAYSLTLAISPAQAEPWTYWFYENKTVGVRLPGWIGLQIGPEFSCENGSYFWLYTDLGSDDYEDGDHVAVEFFVGSRSFRFIEQASVALNRDSVVTIKIPRDVANDLIREFVNAKTVFIALHGGRKVVGKKFSMPLVGFNRAMRAFAKACGVPLDP